jgi:hypothetical protein
MNAVMLGLVMGLMLGWATGCKTASVDGPAVPASWRTAYDHGRNEAVRWYRGKYHAEPKVPEVRVVELPDSRLPGVWAQTVSSTRVDVRASVPQSARPGVLAHEWRHVLNKANGKRDGEADVR